MPPGVVDLAASQWLHDMREGTQVHGTQVHGGRGWGGSSLDTCCRLSPVPVGGWVGRGKQQMDRVGVGAGMLSRL